MISNMKAVGQAEGIAFSYGGYVGNTFDSHRLIWKAREVGGSDLQDKIVESLFRAYFEEEKSLGEAEVLKECTERAGMDEAGTDILADESIGRKEVKMEMEGFGRKWNCRGVPLFVVDGRYPLGGAQPPEAFMEVFDVIEEEA